MALGTPDLAGAVAPTSPVGPSPGGSFIALRIPQSIFLGGRSKIPHQKWCNKRFGEENPPILGKSFHLSSSSCGAGLHLPASCTIPRTRGGSLFPPQPPLPGRQLLSALLKDRNVKTIGSGGAWNKGTRAPALGPGTLGSSHLQAAQSLGAGQVPPREAPLFLEPRLSLWKEKLRHRVRPYTEPGGCYFKHLLDMRFLSPGGLPVGCLSWACQVPPSQNGTAGRGA